MDTGGLTSTKSDPQMREYVGSLWIGFCLGLSLGVLHKSIYKSSMLMEEHLCRS